jgi:hypothetical protein
LVGDPLTRWSRLNRKVACSRKEKQTNHQAENAEACLFAIKSAGESSQSDSGTQAL